MEGNTINNEEPFDPQSIVEQTVNSEETTENHSINNQNTPINLLLERLVNTRHQQDINNSYDEVSAPNPFLRMLHRSIQLIPQQIIINDISNILSESFNSEETKTNPTKKEFIESLQIKTIQEEDSEKTCSICFDKLNIGEKYICLPCNDDHCFHIESCENCEGIRPWLDKNNTCPVCRFELPLEEQSDDETLEEQSDDETLEQESLDDETLEQQQTNDIQVDNREIEENTTEINAEFDIELSDTDRSRIVQIISQRLNTMNTMPPSYSLHFMNSNLDEEGFSNMDMDEAIRQSLES